MKPQVIAEAIAALLQGHGDVTELLPPPASIRVDAAGDRVATIEIAYDDEDETRTETVLTIIVANLPTFPEQEDEEEIPPTTCGGMAPPRDPEWALPTDEEIAALPVPTPVEGNVRRGGPRDSNQLTNAEKARYQIGGSVMGNWTGRCPVCGEYFAANHSSVSQRGVVAAIERHVAEVHAVPDPDADFYAEDDRCGLCGHSRAIHSAPVHGCLLCAHAHDFREPSVTATQAAHAGDAPGEAGSGAPGGDAP